MGRAPSLRVLPWHLPYNSGKSTENLGQGKKSQSSQGKNSQSSQGKNSQNSQGKNSQSSQGKKSLSSQGKKSQSKFWVSKLKGLKKTM